MGAGLDNSLDAAASPSGTLSTADKDVLQVRLQNANVRELLVSLSCRKLCCCWSSARSLGGLQGGILFRKQA